MKLARIRTLVLFVGLAACAASCGGPRVFERAVVIDSIFDSPTGSGSLDQVLLQSHHVQGAEGSFQSVDIPEGWQSLPRGPFVNGQAALNEPLTLSWTPWSKEVDRGLLDPASGVRRARLPNLLYRFEASDEERARSARAILELGGDAYRARLSETTSGPIVVTVALDGAVDEPSAPHGIGWVELDRWNYEDPRSRSQRNWNRAGASLYLGTAVVLYLGVPLLVWVLILG